MSSIPTKLAVTLDLLASIPARAGPTQALAAYAGKYREVAPEVAPRPFPEESRVPACESQAYVFPRKRPDGTLDFHFAVDNPQGISAMALAAILEEAVYGDP